MHRFNIFIAICCLLSMTAKAQLVLITAGTNLQTAIDNATAGTAFLVEAGNYGTINVTKRIALIGTGYLLPKVDGATVAQVNFKTGSDQSVFTGFTVMGDINLGASGLTIQRNRVDGNVLIGYDGTNNLGVGGVIIKQNFLKYIYFNISGSASALVKNNIIIRNIGFGNGGSGQIVNNTILSDDGFSQAYYSSNTISFYNNIVSSPQSFTVYLPDGYIPTNSLFSHNIIKNGQFQTSDPTNIKLDDVNTVFVGSATNGLGSEAKFQLSSNSPAKGKGIGGVDCGAFGGDEPYVISGIPIGPTILSVTGPTGAAAGQTIQVQVRAKVQN